jgi:hypothetical protein
MVGQVMVHNSQLADAVKSEVDQMYDDGRLEAMIRRHTETAVDTAIKDTLNCWAVQDKLRKQFTEAILGTQEA